MAWGASDGAGMCRTAKRPNGDRQGKNALPVSSRRLLVGVCFRGLGMDKGSGVRICFPISPPFILFQPLDCDGQVDLVQFKTVSGLFRLLCKGFHIRGALKCSGVVVHCFSFRFWCQFSEVPPARARADGAGAFMALSRRATALSRLPGARCEYLCVWLMF